MAPSSCESFSYISKQNEAEIENWDWNLLRPVLSSGQIWQKSSDARHAEDYLGMHKLNADRLPSRTLRHVRLHPHSRVYDQHRETYAYTFTLAVHGNHAGIILLDDALNCVARFDNAPLLLNRQANDATMGAEYVKIHCIAAIEAINTAADSMLPETLSYDKQICRSSTALRPVFLAIATESTINILLITINSWPQSVKAEQSSQPHTNFKKICSIQCTNVCDMILRYSATNIVDDSNTSSSSQHTSDSNHCHPYSGLELIVLQNKSLYFYKISECLNCVAANPRHFSCDLSRTLQVPAASRLLLSPDSTAAILYGISDAFVLDLSTDEDEPKILQHEAHVINAQFASSTVIQTFSDDGIVRIWMAVTDRIFDPALSDIAFTGHITGTEGDAHSLSELPASLPVSTHAQSEVHQVTKPLLKTSCSMPLLANTKSDPSRSRMDFSIFRWFCAAELDSHDGSSESACVCAALIASDDGAAFDRLVCLSACGNAAVWHLDFNESLGLLPSMRVSLLCRMNFGRRLVGSVFIHAEHKSLINRTDNSFDDFLLQLYSVDQAALVFDEFAFKVLCTTDSLREWIPEHCRSICVSIMNQDNCLQKMIAYGEWVALLCSSDLRLMNLSRSQLFRSPLDSQFAAPPNFFPFESFVGAYHDIAFAKIAYVSQPFFFGLANDCVDFFGMHEQTLNCFHSHKLDNCPISLLAVGGLASCYVLLCYHKHIEIHEVSNHSIQSTSQNFIVLQSFSLSVACYLSENAIAWDIFDLIPFQNVSCSGGILLFAACCDGSVSIFHVQPNLNSQSSWKIFLLNIVNFSNISRLRQLAVFGPNRFVIAHNDQLKVFESMSAFGVYQHEHTIPILESSCIAVIDGIDGTPRVIVASKQQLFIHFPQRLIGSLYSSCPDISAQANFAVNERTFSSDNHVIDDAFRSVWICVPGPKLPSNAIAMAWSHELQRLTVVLDFGASSALVCFGPNHLKFDALKEMPPYHPAVLYMELQYGSIVRVRHTLTNLFKNILSATIDQTRASAARQLSKDSIGMIDKHSLGELAISVIDIPLLNELTRNALSCLVTALGDALEYEKSLDAFGFRFYFSVRYLLLLKRRGLVSETKQLTCRELAMAMYSRNEDLLYDLLITHSDNDYFTWPYLRSIGAVYWMRDASLLHATELLARNQFSLFRNPQDCMLTYLILQKRNILLGLMKTVPKLQAIYALMSQDMSDVRNRRIVLDNAFRAMSMRRYDIALSFMLLANNISDSFTVCFRQMNEPQLAVLIGRLYNPQSLSSVLFGGLSEHAIKTQDYFLAHIIAYMCNSPKQALQCLSPNVDIAFDASTASLVIMLSELRKDIFEVSSYFLNAVCWRSSFELRRLGCFYLAAEISHRPNERVFQNAQTLKSFSSSHFINISEILDMISEDSKDDFNSRPSLSDSSSATSFSSSNLNSAFGVPNILSHGGFGQHPSSSNSSSATSFSSSNLNSASGVPNILSHGGFGQHPSSSNSSSVTSFSSSNLNSASGVPNILSHGGFGQHPSSSNSSSVTSFSSSNVNSASGVPNMLSHGGFGQHPSSSNSSSVTSFSSSNLNSASGVPNMLSHGGFGQHLSSSNSSSVTSFSSSNVNSASGVPNMLSHGGFGQYPSSSNSSSVTSFLSSNLNSASGVPNMLSHGGFGQHPSSSNSSSVTSFSSSNVNSASGVPNMLSHGGFGQHPSSSNSSSVTSFSSSNLNSASGIFSNFFSVLPDQCFQLSELHSIDSPSFLKSRSSSQALLAWSTAMQSLSLALFSQLTSELNSTYFHVLSFVEDFSLIPKSSSITTVQWLFQNIFAHCTSRHLTNALIVLCSQLSERIVHVEAADLFKGCLNLFLSNEIEGLRSAVFSVSSIAPMTAFGYLVQAFKFLTSWSQLLLDNASRSTIESEWAEFIGLMYGSMLLSGLSLGRIQTVLFCLEGGFANLPSEETFEYSLPDCPVVNPKANEGGVSKSSTFLHVEQTDSESNPVIIDIRSNCRHFILCFVEHGIILHYLQSFQRTFRASPLIQPLQMLLHLLMASSANSFSVLLDNIANNLTDIDDQAAEFRIDDALQPLRQAVSEFSLHGYEAVLDAQLDLSAKLNTIAESISLFYHPNLSMKELYRSDDRLIQSVCINCADPRLIAIAASNGIREINMEISLAYRRRTPAGRLIENDPATWEQCLHIYDQLAVANVANESLMIRQLNGAAQTPQATFRLLSGGICIGNNMIQTSISTHPLYIDFVPKKSNASAATDVRDMIATCLVAHPFLPFYLSSLWNGRILLWHFDFPNFLAEFSSSPSIIMSDEQAIPEKILRFTKLSFDHTGSCIAGTTESGMLVLWSFSNHPIFGARKIIPPIDCSMAHDRGALDLRFIESTLIVTAGNSSDGCNVRFWNTLLPVNERNVGNLHCLPGGATALCLSIEDSVVIAGGQAGQLCFISLTSFSIISTVDTQSSRIHSLCIGGRTKSSLLVGNQDGVLLICEGLSGYNFQLKHSIQICSRRSSSGSSSSLSYFGVTGVESYNSQVIISSADGSVKLMILQ